MRFDPDTNLLTSPRNSIRTRFNHKHTQKNTGKRKTTENNTPSSDNRKFDIHYRHTHTHTRIQKNLLLSLNFIFNKAHQVRAS